jgi:hypothetical protein
MDIGREDFKVYRLGAEETPVIAKASARDFEYATELHVRNFVECVRTRKAPTAPMRLGFQAALVVQMATLSLKHGRKARWDQDRKRVDF